MACPQCARRLLRGFIDGPKSTFTFPFLQPSRTAPAPNPRRAQYTRSVSTTRPRPIRHTSSNSESVHLAESSELETSDKILHGKPISSKESLARGTVPNSTVSSSAKATAVEGADLWKEDQQKRATIQKDLREYLEAKGLDVENMRSRFDDPNAERLELAEVDAESFEPDWRQIPGKHARKKARARFEEDIARLTGRAPLEGITSPDSKSLSEEETSQFAHSHKQPDLGTVLNRSRTRGIDNESSTKPRKTSKLPESKEKLSQTRLANVHGNSKLRRRERRLRERQTIQGSGVIRTVTAPDPDGTGMKHFPVEVTPPSNPLDAHTTDYTSSQRHPNKDKEHWQIDKAAIKEKIGGATWDPKKKLSPDARDGIKALHAQYPDKFTTPVLAQQFGVSPEAIRRILKSKWKPTTEEEEERNERWDRRGERIWNDLAEKGVNPPKRWRDMGIGRDLNRYERKTREAPMGRNKDDGYDERRGSEWISSLARRMR